MVRMADEWARKVREAGRPEVAADRRRAASQNTPMGRISHLANAEKAGGPVTLAEARKRIHAAQAGEDGEDLAEAIEDLGVSRAAELYREIRNP